MSRAKPTKNSSRKGFSGLSGPRILILFLVLVVFLQTTTFEFVNYDDGVNLYHNPATKQGLSVHNLVLAFTEPALGNWIPLSVLSHQLDCQMWGLWAGGHHLMNVALHAAVAVLLLQLLVEWGAPLSWAVVGTIFFAVHPLRVESVAWVSERKDLLSGLFFMLSLLSYTRHVRKNETKPLWGVFIFLCLGLMSKPMLVTVPFLLLLLDVWPLRRLTSNCLGLLREKTLLFFLVLLFSFVTFYNQRQSGAMEALENVGFADRVANALQSCGIYLLQLVWPFHLAVYYPFPVSGVSIPASLLSGLALLLISLAALWTHKTHAWFLNGWFWFLGTLIPVLGVVQVGGQAHADRYTYLPQMGLIVIVVFGGAELGRRHKWGLVAMGLACLLMTAAAFVQTATWRNSVTLWSQCLLATENNATAHYNLGIALRDLKQFTAAIPDLQKAVQLKPKDAQPHMVLGYCYLMDNRNTEAMAEFDLCLALSPHDPEIRYNLGVTWGKIGRHDLAVQELAEAIRMKPAQAVYYQALGYANLVKGDFTAAADAYETSLLLRPHDEETLTNLGITRLRLNQSEKAEENFSVALRINPRFAEAHYNLGTQQAKNKDFVAAIQHLREAVRCRPDYPEAWNNLGLALKQSGRLQESIEPFQRSSALAPDYFEAHLNLARSLKALQRGEESAREYTAAIELARQRGDPALAQAVADEFTANSRP